MQVYRAPLACVVLRLQPRDETILVRQVNPFAVSDCRLLFPPLTAVNASAECGSAPCDGDQLAQRRHHDR